jgi:hypothetical protein
MTRSGRQASKPHALRNNETQYTEQWPLLLEVTVRDNPPLAPFTIKISDQLAWDIHPTWTGIDNTQSALRVGPQRIPLSALGGRDVDPLSAAFLGWSDDTDKVMRAFSEAYPVRTPSRVYRVTDIAKLPAGKRAWFNTSLDGVLVAAHLAHGVRYPDVKVYSYPSAKLTPLAQEAPFLWQGAVKDLIVRIGDRLPPSARSNLEWTLLSRGGGPRFQEGYTESSVHGVPKRPVMGRRVPDSEVRRVAPFAAILFDTNDRSNGGGEQRRQRGHG